MSAIRSEQSIWRKYAEILVDCDETWCRSLNYNDDNNYYFWRNLQSQQRCTFSGVPQARYEPKGKPLSGCLLALLCSSASGVDCGQTFDHTWSCSPQYLPNIWLSQATKRFGGFGLVPDINHLKAPLGTVYYPFERSAGMRWAQLLFDSAGWDLLSLILLLVPYLHLFSTSVASANQKRLIVFDSNERDNSSLFVWNKCIQTERVEPLRKKGRLKCRVLEGSGNWFVSRAINEVFRSVLLRNISSCKSCESWCQTARGRVIGRNLNRSSI